MEKEKLLFIPDGNLILKAVVDKRKLDKAEWLEQQKVAKIMPSIVTSITTLLDKPNYDQGIPGWEYAIPIGDQAEPIQIVISTDLTLHFDRRLTIKTANLPNDYQFSNYGKDPLSGNVNNHEEPYGDIQSRSNPSPFIIHDQDRNPEWRQRINLPEAIACDDLLKILTLLDPIARKTSKQPSFFIFA